MVDRLIFILVIVVIPATILAAIYRWISIEFGLGVIWATVLLTIAIGLLAYLQNPEAYDRSGEPS